MAHIIKLRSYQKELVELSAGSDNVLCQADTGAGKTPVIAQIAKNNTYVLCIAHRTILVRQLSKMLARFNIKHNVIAAKHTVRQCILEHRRLGNDAILNKNKNKHVVSIDSLLSRHRRGLLSLDVNKKWVIIVDEAHHMIDKNKWGKLLKIFPNSRIVGFTATPCRLDQESLSRKKGGVFDRLAQASELKKNSVRTLIEKGYLSDFKAYSVPERIDANTLQLGKHDYTYKSLDQATNTVVYEMAGDAVTHYKRLANGKQALAFCVSIQIAKKTAESFKQAGIASAAIHSEMGMAESARIFDLFQQRVIKVLVNVDMIGEGVDVPAIEALIMLRKTASFGLYRQWIGRSLRPEEDKPFAILIDHTGNIRKHGLPDQHIDWDLDNPPQAVKSNLFPCPECFALVKAWVEECPECGADLKRAVDAKTETDVKYIDYTLVEIKRREIDEKIKKQAREKELRENLIILNENIGSKGALDKAIHRIKTWLACTLQQQGVTIYELNQLFLAEKGQDFWITNFQLSDLDTKNEKCQRIYKKWLKSQ